MFNHISKQIRSFVCLVSQTVWRVSSYSGKMPSWVESRSQREGTLRGLTGPRLNGSPARLRVAFKQRSSMANSSLVALLELQSLELKMVPGCFYRLQKAEGEAGSRMLCQSLWCLLVMFTAVLCSAVQAVPAVPATDRWGSVEGRDTPTAASWQHSAPSSPARGPRWLTAWCSILGERSGWGGDKPAGTRDRPLDSCSTCRDSGVTLSPWRNSGSKQPGAKTDVSAVC